MAKLTPEEEVELAAHHAATSDKLRPTRDPDGFRKQVLVVTEAGKWALLWTLRRAVLCLPLRWRLRPLRVWLCTVCRGSLPSRAPLWAGPGPVHPPGGFSSGATGS
jgi:hypothetical protein